MRRANWLFFRPERWVSDYAHRYLRSRTGSVIRRTDGVRRTQMLTGDVRTSPSMVPAWSGLEDTPRERVAAAQRYADLRALEFECKFLAAEEGEDKMRIYHH